MSFDEAVVANRTWLAFAETLTGSHMRRVLVKDEGKSWPGTMREIVNK